MSYRPNQPRVNSLYSPYDSFSDTEQNMAFREILKDVIEYINESDKVNLLSVGQLEHYIQKNLQICPYCEMKFLKSGPSVTKHINECLDLMEDKDIKDAVAQLIDFTGRPKREVLLVARHVDFKDPDEVNRAFEILVSGIDVEEWKKKEKVVKKECAICLNDFPIAEMFTLDCVDAHRYCLNCIKEHINGFLKEMKSSMCPGVSCKYEITELEINQIYGKNSSEVGRYSEILLKRSLQQLNAVGCPTPGCKNYLVPFDKNSPEKCFCEQCNLEFCSLCKNTFHYFIFCNEALELTAKWIQWNETGRNAYYFQNEEHQNKLKQFEEELKRVSVRNKELKERYDELLNDEKWKEANCKGCPKCGRPIQKLEGCDSMVCGQDAHGGNIQNGCGQRFAWTAAPQYKSAAMGGPTKEKLNAEPPPPIVKKSHGLIRCNECVPGEDGNVKEIMGLRFTCVNCRYYHLCEDCEVKHAHKHFGGRHIFRTILPD